VADVRRQRMTVYVCIPPNRLADARVLLNLFFAQLINLNTAELPEHNPALKHQCLVLLDEFTALGRINILNAAVGYLAGYNLRLVTVIQAVSQLESVYGQHDARTFATNHALQVLYAPREQRDANEYSEMLGTFTQQEKSRGRSNSSGAKGGSSSQSTNESSQRRALLLPQEFKELGLDHEVLILENCKPIMADKIRYYTDPVFMARLMPPPELPELDLATHRARVEQRVRLAGDDEEFGLDQIAVDFHGLPQLAADASPEQMQCFVTSFFEALEVASVQPGDLTSQPQSNLESARAA
jgi:type IV secretion system protein VirD4